VVAVLTPVKTRRPYNCFFCHRTLAILMLYIFISNVLISKYLLLLMCKSETYVPNQIKWEKGTNIIYVLDEFNYKLSRINKKNERKI